MRKTPKVSNAGNVKLKTNAENARILRSAAETQLNQYPHTDPAIRTYQDALHELEVHQIELEMQNEELRQAQAILEASRERYIDFYDFAPVGYLTLGGNGALEEINLTGATMLGEERTSLLKREFSRFVVPQERAGWKEQLARILNNDNTFTSEMTLQRRDNTRLHVQLDSLRLLKNGKQAVVRIALTDITGRIRIEEAIREQEEFFRLITENIEDFIAVLDLEGKRLYNSPSYAKLFANTDLLAGSDSFSEIHPDDRDRVRQVFRETVQSGIGMKIEYRFMLADGSMRHMESQGALIRSCQGHTSRVVVISRDISERKLNEEKIRNLAYFDSLTRLPNRRMLDDRMYQAMAASKRSGRYCGLMFLDLDNFKPLNDHHGHGAGDVLLQDVAQRISACVREMDTVARFGGDEFVVMLGELDIDRESSVAQTMSVAEKILAAISSPYRLTTGDPHHTTVEIEHQCTASIGVLIFTGHDKRPDELLNMADKAMYQAKNKGRNRVCFTTGSA